MHSTNRIILQPLTVTDAEIFYALYAHPELAANEGESPFFPNETPQAFTKRIISLCECIFTIRPVEDPQRVIGDCALHHWDKQKKEISIGGALFPEYWGKGYMRAAFEQLIERAGKELGVTAILGQTRPANVRAIRLVEKMGFENYQTGEEAIILRKEI